MIPGTSHALRRLLDDVGTGGCGGHRGTGRQIRHPQHQEGRQSSSACRLAVSMVDLTTLEGKDTPGKVASLCAESAVSPHDAPDIPQVAAVCVYPSMVKHAAKHVKGTPVRIASVATAFPSGQAPLKTRLAEVRQAVADGADEIDMVINRGAFLAGELALVQDEISAVLEACGSSHAQGDPRNQRTRNLRQHPRRLLSRHARPAPRRFHQDLHRQDLLQRHARQQPGDARGHPRPLPRHRHPRSP